MDLGIYAALATLIGAIGGIVSGLINNWVQAKVQKRSLDLQERREDSAVVSASTEAASQLASNASQQAIQLYTTLQACIQARQEAYDKIHVLEMTVTKRDLQLQRAVYRLEELLREHEAEYKAQGFQCKFFEPAQGELARILAALKEPPSGTA